ncbi:MAG TPA: helix-turn-helix transcriptional regulator [Polyangiaceae bacterium]|nr:helix-turn-helix transcriptional regulator [Polyangiaceae bacterium]
MALERKQWSQVDLAIKLGVNKSAVCRFVNGTKVPTLGVAVCIEELLGIPVAHWVDP